MSGPLTISYAGTPPGRASGAARMRRLAAFAALLFMAAGLRAAAQPAQGPEYAEIRAPDGRVLKKVRIDRREEVIDGKRFLLRGSYVRSRDSRHKVVYERAEDLAVEDRATRRSSQTTLFTWYGADGAVIAARKFGGRFATAALSDSGEFLAAVDKCYDDILIPEDLPPSETRAERELSKSYLYVFDHSWRTVYSTSALRGDWNPVLLSPAGKWLVYDNAAENDSAAEKNWALTAVELATNRVFRLVWERDLYYPEVGDDGSVSAQRFLGLTVEKVPMKGMNGSTVMARKPIYIKFIWKPGESGGFKAVKQGPGSQSGDDGRRPGAGRPD